MWFFLFVIEKSDFLVEMPSEREVLWFFSRVQTVRRRKIPKSEAPPMVVLSKNMGGGSCHSHEGSIPLWAYCVSSYPCKLQNISGSLLTKGARCRVLNLSCEFHFVAVLFFPFKNHTLNHFALLATTFNIFFSILSKIHGSDVIQQVI